MPPVDWLDRLAAADAIYISHNHSDHLNPHTLRLLASRNPSVRLLVPDFESASVTRLLERLGLTPFESVGLGSWVDLAEDLRIMLLGDVAGRDDSGLLVDHGGHVILNTVDTARLNDLHLPAPVDVLMCSFAGGASGFPLCWPELYGPDEIGRRLASNRRAHLDLVTELVRTCRPAVAVPFAGYFHEAHPDDAEIAVANRKNTWADFDRAVAAAGTATQVWHPHAGQRLDVGPSVQARGALKQSVPPSRSVVGHDFERWTDEIARTAATVSGSAECLRRYFEWAGLGQERCVPLGDGHRGALGGDLHRVSGPVLPGP